MPRELLRRSRHLHIASYFLQPKLQPGLPELADAAHGAGAGVSLDTGFDPGESWDSGLLSLLPHVDVFLPNEVEAQAISEMHSVDAALATLCALTDLVALKVGADGALACHEDQTIHLPAFAVDVVDTTCCGDAFNAGFIDGLLSALPLRDCVARGNACGGLMASVVGNDAGVLSDSAIARIIGGAGR